jgi:hypothetical protein
MSRENGEVWIHGTNLRFVDGAGDEWQYQGEDQGPAGAGREQGEIWFTNGADTVNYVDNNGRHRSIGAQLDNNPEAVQGDIWIRHDDGAGSKIIFVTDSAVTATPHTNFTPHTDKAQHEDTGTSKYPHKDEGHDDFGNTDHNDTTHTDNHEDRDQHAFHNFTNNHSNDHDDFFTNFSNFNDFFSNFNNFHNFNNFTNFGNHSNFFSNFSNHSNFGNFSAHSNRFSNFGNGWWSEENSTVGGPVFESGEADEIGDDDNPSTAPMGHTNQHTNSHMDTSDHLDNFTDTGHSNKHTDHDNFSHNDSHIDGPRHEDFHTDHSPHTDHTDAGSHQDGYAEKPNSHVDAPLKGSHTDNDYY